MTYEVHGVVILFTAATSIDLVDYSQRKVPQGVRSSARHGPGDRYFTSRTRATQTPAPFASLKHTLPDVEEVMETILNANANEKII